MTPLDSKQIEEFVPASLLNVAPTPTFRFRAPTPRDQQRYNHQLTVEGIRLFDDSAIRQEVLRVLKSEWDEETFLRESARLETAWESVDQKIELPEAEVLAIAELTARCMEVSPFLRRMDADNRAFAENAPAVALGMFLVGWSGLETPFRMEGGIVPYDTLVKLSRELRTVEERATADKVEGVNVGLSFLELSLKAFGLLNLEREEEKNSSAPSPSSETPSGSKTTSPGDGASETTSSAAEKTRPARSRKAAKTS